MDDYKKQHDPDWPYTRQFERKQIFQFRGMNLKAFRMCQRVIEGGLDALLMHAEKHLDSTPERRGMKFFEAYYNESRDQTGAVEVCNDRLSLNLSRRTWLRNLKRFKENIIGLAAEDLLYDELKYDGYWKITGREVPDLALECGVDTRKKDVFQYPRIVEVKCRDFDEKHSVQWWLEHKMRYAPPFLSRGIELVLILVFYTQGSLIREEWLILNPSAQPTTSEGWASAGELIERLPKFIEREEGKWAVDGLFGLEAKKHEY